MFVGNLVSNELKRVHCYDSKELNVMSLIFMEI